MRVLEDIRAKLDAAREGNPLIGAVALARADELRIGNTCVDAPKIFPYLRQLIADANDEVLMNFYAFEPSADPAQEILQGLQALAAAAEKDRRVVAVKILVNKKAGLAAAGLGSSDAWVGELVAHLDTLTRYLDVSFRTYPLSGTAGIHSKQVIVDRRCVCLITGDPKRANNFGASADRPMIHHELATPIVSRTLALAACDEFAKLWEMASDVALTRPAPSSERPAEEVKYEAGSSSGPVEVTSEEEISRGPGTEPLRIVTVPARAVGEEQAEEAVLYMAKRPWDSVLTGQPRSPYLIALTHMLAVEKERVAIMTSNLNSVDILAALVACVKRGVSVKLLLGRYHSEMRECLPAAGGTNEWAVHELIQRVRAECPAHVDKLQVSWACDKNGALVVNGAPGTIHCKTALTSFVVSTGSSPGDRQGLERNAETDWLICSPTTVADYWKQFDALFDRARPVDERQLETRAKLEAAVSRYEKAPNTMSIDDLAQLYQRYRLCRADEPRFRSYMAALVGLFCSGRSREDKVKVAKRGERLVKAAAATDELERISYAKLLTELETLGTIGGADGLLPRIIALAKAVVRSPSMSAAAVDFEELPADARLAVTTRN